MKPISFVPVVSKKEYRITQFWMWGTGVISVGALLLLWYLYKPFFMQLWTQRAEIRKLETLVSKNKQALDRYSYIKGMQEEYRQQQDKFEYYEQHPNMSISLFGRVTGIAKNAGIIDHVHCDKKRLTLQMDVSDPAQVTNMAQELRLVPQIKKVAIASLHEKNNDNKRYCVSLTIMSKC